MKTLFIAILVLCSSGECVITSTNRQVYSDYVSCMNDVGTVWNLFIREVPEPAGNAVCMPFKLGEA